MGSDHFLQNLAAMDWVWILIRMSSLFEVWRIESIPEAFARMLYIFNRNDEDDLQIKYSCDVTPI